MFLQLFIINRSGGLVYNKNLSSAAPNLSTNDCLRLGMLFNDFHRGEFCIQIKLLMMCLFRINVSWFICNHSPNCPCQCCGYWTFGNGHFGVAVLANSNRNQVRNHCHAWHVWVGRLTPGNIWNIFRFCSQGKIGLYSFSFVLRNQTDVFFIFWIQNPFYEMEMPIRCDLFNRHLDKLIIKTNGILSQSKRRPA
jgi:hypothetical protein